MFLKFLYSHEIISVFGTLLANSVSSFVNRHVFNWEKDMLFIHRKNVRHYFEYSNTPLEGENYALKHSGVRTHPQLPLQNSLQIVSQLAEKRFSEITDRVVTLDGKVSTNSIQSVHNKLTPTSSSELSYLVGATKYFISHRLDGKKWLVTRNRQYDYLIKTVVPRFRRVRTVTWKNGQLFCTCPYTQVNGIPCVHALTVAQNFSPKWVYPSYLDVSVTWWKSYYLYSLPCSQVDEKERYIRMRHAFHTMKKFETVGIHIGLEILDIQNFQSTTAVPSDFITQEGNVSCVNYPDSSTVDDFDEYSSNLIPGCSQLSVEHSQRLSPDDEALFDFVRINQDDDDIAINKNDKKSVTLYERMKPAFYESYNWMRSIGTEDDVDKYCSFMEQLIGDLKQRYTNTKKKNNIRHEYVSSNLPIETSYKHHGCHGYRRETKKRKNSDILI